MSIDFNKPVKTDNYDTGMLASIRAHAVALACWLAPGDVGTVSNPVAGARRYNDSSTVFERYNGSSWVEMSTAYLKAATAASIYAPLGGAGATGTWGISIAGNAATATALATPRTINGVSFNGTANITIADSTKLPLAGGNVTGNLGLSVASPAAKLHVEGTGPIQTLLRTASASSYTSLRLYNDQNSALRALEIDYMGSSYSGGEQASVLATGAYPLNLGTNNLVRLEITANGGVSIGGGYTNTAGDLGVARSSATATGVVYFSTTNYKYLYYDGTNFSLTGGDLTCSGNVTAYSDARLKKNVVQISDALSKVRQIRGVTFERINDPTNRRQTGVIAQELQVVLPEAVTSSIEDEINGGTTPVLSVNYGSVIGLLIEAIKELERQVQELRSQR